MKPTRATVTLKQCNLTEYRVTKATNTVKPRIGTLMVAADVEVLIGKGVTVNIS